DGRWYPPQRKGLPDAALALITLGCGVVGLFILTAFAALGFGVYALVQLATRRANPAWFVVTVVGMLAGLGWLYLASTANW
ncbi:MAG TPA: hypothetical protein VKR22_01250, partial [Acidimicrobiales bacterium]|nr:hypothetical protein [Acidimicrobiales bacterium]